MLKHTACLVLLISIAACLIPAISFATSEVVINEFMANPQEDEQEWIELYNTATQPKNISGYVIEDLAQNQVKIAPNTEISTTGYHIIALNKQILNNSSDTILLKDSHGQIIDTYSYSNSEKGFSFARIPDGGDFITNATPSRGQANLSLDLGADSTSSPSATQVPVPTPYPAQILISEIFPAPSNGGKEWIELINHSNNAVNLQDWYFKDSQENKRQISNQIIPGKSYLHISFSSGYLNNDGDTVSLFDQYHHLKDISPHQYNLYRESTSWSKVDGVWCETDTTPSKPNSACVPIPTASPQPNDSTSESDLDLETSLVSSENQGSILSSQAQKLPHALTGTPQPSYNRKLPIILAESSAAAITTPQRPTSNPNHTLSSDQAKEFISSLLPFTFIFFGLSLLGLVSLVYLKPDLLLQIHIIVTQKLFGKL